MGPQQVIKTEENTVYERGNEATSAWLSEAILELHRKISTTKKRETFNFFFHSPHPQLDATVQLTILVIVRFCIWAEKSFKRE